MGVHVAVVDARHVPGVAAVVDAHGGSHEHCTKLGIRTTIVHEDQEKLDGRTRIHGVDRANVPG